VRVSIDIDMDINFEAGKGGHCLLLRRWGAVQIGKLGIKQNHMNHPGDNSPETREAALTMVTITLTPSPFLQNV